MDVWAEETRPVGTPGVPALEALVARVLGVGPGEVDGATGPATDGRWTSLRHLQVVAEVQRVYGTRLSPRQIRAIRSVDDLRDTLDGHA